MQELFRALDQWSTILSDRDTRRRALEMFKQLIVIVAEVSRNRSYGKFGVEFDAEAGKITHWRSSKEDSHL